jgi:hypothetical protein
MRCLSNGIRDRSFQQPVRLRPTRSSGHRHHPQRLPSSCHRSERLGDQHGCDGANLRKVPSHPIRHCRTGMGPEQPLARRVHGSRIERRQRWPDHHLGRSDAFRSVFTARGIHRFREPDPRHCGRDLGRSTLALDNRCVLAVHVRDVLHDRSFASLVDAGCICLVDGTCLVPRLLGASGGQCGHRSGRSLRGLAPLRFADGGATHATLAAHQ